jgi:hypothetical protein
MSLLLLVGLAALGSYLVGRRWAVAIVPVAGQLVWLIIASTSGSSLDTPVPFVIALATRVSVVAMLVRGRALTARWAAANHGATGRPDDDSTDIESQRLDEAFEALSGADDARAAFALAQGLLKVPVPAGS